MKSGNNKRKLEMKSVSNYLGYYRIKSNNPLDYSLLASTYLDKNVISDFRYRTISPYTNDEEAVIGIETISMDTDSLKTVIENKVKYKYFYGVFDNTMKYH